jgi:hypothetical protein
VRTDGSDVVFERAATSEIGRFATTFGRVTSLTPQNTHGDASAPLQGQWAINSITAKICAHRAFDVIERNSGKNIPTWAQIKNSHHDARSLFTGSQRIAVIEWDNRLLRHTFANR